MVSRKRRVVFSILLISVIFCLAAACFVKQINADTIDSIEIFCPAGTWFRDEWTYRTEDPELIQAILFYFDKIHYSVPTDRQQTQYAVDWPFGYCYVSFYHGAEPVRTYRFTVEARSEGHSFDCIQFGATDNWYDWYMMEDYATTTWCIFMSILRDPGSADYSEASKAGYFRLYVMMHYDPSISPRFTEDWQKYL